MPLNDETSAVDGYERSVRCLRRYGRCLLGHQEESDRFAFVALRSMAEQQHDSFGKFRTLLFRMFHRLWSDAGCPIGPPGRTERGALEEQAQHRLAILSPQSRAVLLLTAVERLGQDEISAILDLTPESVAAVLNAARIKMAQILHSRVLIVEDEALISMNMAEVLDEAGHRVTGIGRTREEAVSLARREEPDLILADVQLADGSSGIDAVHDIQRTFFCRRRKPPPVIYVSAFPERFLREADIHSSCLILKPFSEDELRSAISQAVFFSSIHTIAGGIPFRP